MSDPMPAAKPKRTEFRNINAFTDLTTYRMPAAAIVSILHRASGAIMFAFLPFIIWMFDKSISSEYSFAKFKAAFNVGVWGMPGWLFKLVAVLLIWAFLHHWLAGIRHVVMDVSHKAVTKARGKSSAMAVFAISIPIAVVLGAKLFGLY